MISKISKTLKITWEPIQYTVITVWKYLNHGLRLREGQLYTFAEVPEGGIKGKLTEP